MYIVKLSQAISPEDLPTVAVAAANLFKTEPSRMENLLAQAGTQLTKPLEQDKAERMASMLEQIGLTVEIVELPSEAHEIPVTQMDTPVGDPVAKPNYLKHWPDALLIFAFLALTSGIGLTLVTGRSFSFIAQNVAPVSAASSTVNPTNNSVSNDVLAEVDTNTAVSSGPVIETVNADAAEPETVDVEATEAVAELSVTIDPSVLVTPLESDDAITQESSLLPDVSIATADAVVAETLEFIAEEPEAVVVEVVTEEPEAVVIEERIVAVIPEMDLSAVAEESPTEEFIEAVMPETMTEEVAEVVTEASESVAEATPTTEFVVKNLNELSTGKYLQAGAYKTTESALNQKAALERLGFAVTPAQDVSFVVLLVGPYSDEDLSIATTTLSAGAVSHYQRNLP